MNGSDSSWKGFVPRLVANILGTVLGVFLAALITFEYVSYRIDRKMEQAGEKIERKIDQLKNDIHKPQLP